jgi:hypothetical protein
MNAISDTTSATQTETQPQQMTTVTKKKSWYEICIEEEEEERLREEEERKKMKEISDNRKELLAQGKYELEEGEILE